MKLTSELLYCNWCKKITCHLNGYSCIEHAWNPLFEKECRPLTNEEKKDVDEFFMSKFIDKNRVPIGIPQPHIYGNNDFWCHPNIKGMNGEIYIWRHTDNDCNHFNYIIATAINLEEAKFIIDALIKNTTADRANFSPKEIAFLELIEQNCTEPYAGMASDALLWKTQESRKTYNELKSKFSQFYE